MAILLVTHEFSLQHLVPRGHPERPERVEATVSGIRGSAVDIIDIEAPEVDRSLLESVHDATYVDEVQQFCLRGGGAFDEDTYAVPASYDAALHAAGAGPCAVDTLMRGVAVSAFVAVRPPGHHAERHQAMGFCLFNNVAVTAAYLRSMGSRVAIVDWDVHHGNGTQHSFWTDPEVLYISMHEFPFYPGTGWVTESGQGGAAGTTVNIPLPGGTSSSSQRAAFRRVVLPVLEQFAPDWILVSAGYDAHKDDPLGGLNLESGDYGQMAAALTSVVPSNRVVAFLEGGYDLDALVSGAAATVEGLAGLREQGEWPTVLDGSSRRVVDLAVEALKPFWELV
ncbi:MAG: histone deacetylase [Actinomycetia bacterium]|nr:histone deacetylase [Actinomycetes bacterium]